MQKYFINKIIDNQASFLKEDEYHLLNVLRINLNEEVIGFYHTKRYLLQITNLNPLRAKVIKQLDVDTLNPFKIDVFMAAIKPKHMELAIIKACELNVANFYIFYSHYSQHNLTYSIARLEKLIKETCQQCNRSDLMHLKILNSTQELISLCKQNDFNFVADFTNDSYDLNTISSHKDLSLAIIIGPEGGFSTQDYEQYLNKIDFKKNNLTKTILRTETAMMYLVSVISYILLKNEKQN